MSKRYIKKNKWLLYLLPVVLVFGIIIGIKIWRADAISGDDVNETDLTQAENGGVEVIPGYTEIANETELSDSLKQIETKYGIFCVSKSKDDKLIHQEVVDDSITMERFAMLLDNEETELFRIYFGDASQGNPIGFLQTESGDILVSVSVCNYEASYFENEEDFRLYHALMEELNTIITSICSNSQYRALSDAETQKNNSVEAELEFGKIRLLDSMEWKEYNRDGLYWVDIFGEVAGEEILVYTVYIGETEADTMIGYYAVEGDPKPVWIQMGRIQPNEYWTDKDINSAYEFMATVDDLIQTIMASENFSAEIPG